jgi:BirA family biotin operon repressor/biotin-[acetyl-CoA-carboxylase] ligase
MNIIKIDTCLSTNSFLKELSSGQRLENGTILVAKDQTAGRGQTGTQWEAESGKNLTFSVLLYPHFLPLKDNFLLSEMIALSLKDVLDTYTENISIKWPNDIYYQNKKIAGILIENEITGTTLFRSIIGIGININQETFRSDAPNPISLKQITGKNTCLDDLLEQLSAAIGKHYERLQKGETESIVRDYHEALYRKEGFYPYKDREEVFFARIESVANDGILHLISEKGEKRCYTFKAVTMLPLR